MTPAENTSGPDTEAVRYVDWAAVSAGAVMATALSLVLLTFGAAIGLSATSPWANSGLSAKPLAMLGGAWTMALHIGAALAGGYIAGRMRTRSRASADEVQFRDGLHGGLVWAVSTLAGAVVIAVTAGAIARGAADAATRLPTADPITTQIDTLLRPANRAATSVTAALASTAASTAAGPAVDQVQLRQELVRVFARAVTTGELAPADRSYLSTVVASRTGLSVEESDRRVDSVFSESLRIIKATADATRRAGVATGLVAALGLMIGLAAAWWGGIRGGHHRDTNVPARFIRVPAVTSPR